MDKKTLARRIAKIAALQIYKSIVGGKLVKKASRSGYSTKDLARLAAVSAYNAVIRVAQETPPGNAPMDLDKRLNQIGAVALAKFFDELKTGSAALDDLGQAEKEWNSVPGVKNNPSQTFTPEEISFMQEKLKASGAHV